LPPRKYLPCQCGLFTLASPRLQLPIQQFPTRKILPTPNLNPNIAQPIHRPPDPHCHEILLCMLDLIMISSEHIPRPLRRLPDPFLRRLPARANSQRHNPATTSPASHATQIPISAFRPPSYKLSQIERALDDSGACDIPSPTTTFSKPRRFPIAGDGGLGCALRLRDCRGRRYRRSGMFEGRGGRSSGVLT